MPLLINGTVLKSVPASLASFIEQHPHLKEAAERLCSEEIKTVSPPGLLYVGQRELATVAPDDNYIHILGTDDATTCHIAVLRHSGSGVTSLCHFDGCDTAEGIKCMIRNVAQQSLGKPDGRFNMQLVGGFHDQRNESIKLSREIIEILIKVPEEIHLVQMCLTDLNDTLRDGVHYPIIYGLGVDVRTGRSFPASFTDKGPEMPIRSAHHFTGSCKQIADIYRGNGVITIGPFTWEPWDDIDMWVSLPDHIYRRYLSTSPEQEPAHFANHVREALKVIQQHPKPSESIFVDNQPLHFQKQSDGSWLKIT